MVLVSVLEVHMQTSFSKMVDRNLVVEQIFFLNIRYMEYFTRCSYSNITPFFQEN